MYSKELKYVIVDHLYPILFSHAQKHSDYREFNITSAGMCKINFDDNDNRYTADVYGESISLGMKPNEHDKRRIEYMLNQY